MEKPLADRFDKLEALIEKSFADIRADLKNANRQLEAKDTQIGALLERMREYAITMRAVVSNDDK
jgi:hypothetical protein